eukprot:649320_1
MDDSVRLFFGGLPKNTSHVSLTSRLNRIVSTLDVTVLHEKNETGNCRGFAYVSVASQADALRIMKTFNKTRWKGKVLRVEPAKESAPMRVRRLKAEEGAVRRAVAAQAAEPVADGPLRIRKRKGVPVTVVGPCKKIRFTNGDLPIVQGSESSDSSSSNPTSDGLNGLAKKTSEKPLFTTVDSGLSNKSFLFQNMKSWNKPKSPTASPPDRRPRFEPSEKLKIDRNRRTLQQKIEQKSKIKPEPIASSQSVSFSRSASPPLAADFLKKSSNIHQNMSESES